ncbi:hypothetical protein F4818DRAFT_406852 [Hypoxylon cercidicola]|nr:hypothetical protein F4818DRAFT_406852 [Hypoxylon cercidicola]
MKSLIVTAIVNPNHDSTLWESGAIITYLIENHNPKRLLTYDTRSTAGQEDNISFQNHPKFLGTDIGGVQVSTSFIFSTSPLLPNDTMTM